MTKFLETIGSANLYTDEERFFITNVDNAIVFTATYEAEIVNYFNVLTNLRIWRSMYYSFGDISLSHKMFFKYILPIKGIVVSDKSRTAEGKRFWEARVAEALALGFYSYVFNEDTETFHPIDSYSSLSKKSNEIWDYKGDFLNYRIFISTKAL